MPYLARVSALLGAGLFVACAATPRDRVDADAGSNGNPSVDGGGANMFGGEGGAMGSGTGAASTCADAAQLKSYAGCDYWPTTVANPVWSIFDFAVVVSNVSTGPASVHITGPNGVDKNVTIPPGTLQKIALPWVPALKGEDSGDCGDTPPLTNSVVAVKSAYHLVSTVPIIVYQFSPLEYQGKGGTSPSGGPKDWSKCPGTIGSCSAFQDQPIGCYSYSNDASLLLPSTAMTGTYRVSGYHGLSEIVGGIGPYIAITGTADATHVTVKLAAAASVFAELNGAFVDTKGSGTITFTLGAGDVAEIAGQGSDKVDLSGSLVTADKPVQVISGSQCQFIPDSSTQACDHLEETLFPAESLGKHYLIGQPTAPRGDLVGHVVRFTGDVDGTTLTYAPARPPGCPATLSAGQVVECEGVVTKDFEVSGDHEFVVSTYMLGSQKADTAPPIDDFPMGDPSSSLFVAVEQYRSQYVFLAPDDYDVSYVDIYGPAGAAPILDGAPVSAAFTAFGAYGVWRQKLGAGNGGAHTLTSSKPVGIQVIGYGAATSYQYPGGLNLEHIAPPPVR